MTDLLRVGELLGGSGTSQPPTAGVTGAQRVQIAHGEYTDAASRGRIFSLKSGAVTLDSANVTTSALATATFINGIANPSGSGKLLSILRAQIATVSGTPGGPFFYDYYSNVLVTNAATGTIRSNYLSSNAAGSSVATPLVDVVLTVSGGSTAALLQLGAIGGPAAIAAGAGLYGTIDEVRGSIIVPPGTIFGIMATAAGTTHVVHSTLTWEEIPALS